MVILISGATHTGKTLLAQEILEVKKIPYLSLDHLKMGLILSGMTRLSVHDDALLTPFLWQIVSPMISTVIENNQFLTIEGCYIPMDWKDSFTKDELASICQFSLVMSESYIRGHYREILNHSSVIEKRKVDECALEGLVEDNRTVLEGTRAHQDHVIMIDKEHDSARIMAQVEPIFSEKPSVLETSLFVRPEM